MRQDNCEGNLEINDHWNDGENTRDLDVLSYKDLLMTIQPAWENHSSNTWVMQTNSKRQQVLSEKTELSGAKITRMEYLQSNRRETCSIVPAHVTSAVT